GVRRVPECEPVRLLIRNRRVRRLDAKAVQRVPTRRIREPKGRLKVTETMRFDRVHSVELRQITTDDVPGTVGYDASELCSSVAHPRWGFVHLSGRVPPGPQRRQDDGSGHE